MLNCDGLTLEGIQEKQQRIFDAFKEILEDRPILQSDFDEIAEKLGYEWGDIFSQTYKLEMRCFNHQFNRYLTKDEFTSKIRDVVRGENKDLDLDLVSMDWIKNEKYNY